MEGVVESHLPPERERGPAASALFFTSLLYHRALENEGEQNIFVIFYRQNILAVFHLEVIG